MEEIDNITETAGQPGSHKISQNVIEKLFSEYFIQFAQLSVVTMMVSLDDRCLCLAPPPLHTHTHNITAF